MHRKFLLSQINPKISLISMIMQRIEQTNFIADLCVSFISDRKPIAVSVLTNERVMKLNSTILHFMENLKPSLVEKF